MSPGPPIKAAGIKDQTEKEEEKGDEYQGKFIKASVLPQGKFEDKLASKEEMTSFDPFLAVQSSSSLATFAFVEPTGAATDSDDEQVNNVNQI